jgi:mannosyltransferase
VAVMVAMLMLEIISPTAPVKEDYRGAAEYLAAHAGPQDIILLSAPFTVYPVEYYYRGSAPLATLPIWDRYKYGPIPAFSPERLSQDVESQIEAHQYAWVLLSYDQGYQEDIRQYFEQSFERVSETHFSPGLDLYQYKLRYDTPLSDSEEVSSTQ